MKPARRREGDILIPLLRVILDALTISLSFLLSYWLRFDSGVFEWFNLVPAIPPPLGMYVLSSGVMVIVILLLFNFRKAYRSRRRVSLSDEMITIGTVATQGMLILLSVAFFYREFSYSRIVFVLIWLTMMPMLFFGRALVASVERKLHRRGMYLKRALIVGNDALANDVYRRLHRHPSFGFDIAGYLADMPAAGDLQVASCPYRGSIDGAAAVIERESIDTVFLALRSQEHQRMFDLASECEGLDVEFLMVPDVLDVLTSQVRLTEYEGLPFLTLKANSLTAWGRITKRSMDIVMSAGLLMILSPLLLVIALLIKVTSRGPVLYRQERLGLDGSPFQILKFRSMVPEAEAAGNPVWTRKGDPRRTAVGAFLRKSSLDELPQLLNVLWGDMSLVGPRPERPFFVEQFRGMVPKYMDRHRVRAGITGWAQVNGLRGDTSIGERIKYDLYYIENWSLAFDLKILLRTLRAAFTKQESRRS